MKAAPRLHLCTTVHPAVLRFLDAWHTSAQAQTDQAFEYWVILHGLGASDVRPIFGDADRLHTIEVSAGASIADVRQVGFSALAACTDLVVFADCDDLLEPDRIASARRWLADADVVACAMRIIEEDGRDAGMVFAPPELPSRRLVVGMNAFGLSNTAWRSTALRAALPVPHDLVVVDWYLATRALAVGARLAVDGGIRMRYRQYGENIARVIPPFSAGHVVDATRYVLRHYRAVVESQPGGELAEAVAREQCRAERFSRAIDDAGVLARYVSALNGLSGPHLWWTTVAHPSLEDVWNS